jgi:GDP-L-fucose synthase
MGRLHEAKVFDTPSVEVWGSGTPVRDFFFVEDCADGLIHLLETYSDEGPINLGTGREVSIRELAQTIAEVVGYKGDLAFNTTKPDGMPRKVLNVSQVNQSGWSATTPLADGLRATYEWYLRAISVSESGEASGK